MLVSSHYYNLFMLLFIGCITDCGRFWCYCRGFSVLWSEKSSEELKAELADKQTVMPQIVTTSGNSKNARNYSPV